MTTQHHKAALATFDNINSNLGVIRAAVIDLTVKYELDGAAEAYNEAVKVLRDVSQLITGSIDNEFFDAEKRGMKFLAALCGKLDLEFDAILQKHENIYRGALSRYLQSASELEKKGFTPKQTANSGLDARPDEAKHLGRMARLKAERMKIVLFLKDSPRYDMAILEGTRFEGWTLETNKFHWPYTSPTPKGLRIGECLVESDEFNG